MPRPLAPSDESAPPDAGYTCVAPAVLDDALRSIRAAAARLPYGSRAERVAQWLVMALELGDADLGEWRGAGLPAPTPRAEVLAGSGLTIAWAAGGREVVADIAYDGSVTWFRRRCGAMLGVDRHGADFAAAVDAGRGLIRWLTGRNQFSKW